MNIGWFDAAQIKAFFQIGDVLNPDGVHKMLNGLLCIERNDSAGNV